MIQQIPTNAAAFSTYTDMSVEEIKFAPFYASLVELHSSYAAGKRTDTEYAEEMERLISANPDYAENLTNLKVRLLAHI